MPANLKPNQKRIKTEPSQPQSNLTRTFQPMTLAHYDELSAIWLADKRIPSASSRRAWALARNLKPDTVNRWWYRRKLVAKKAGFAIPKGTYELVVGTPPTLQCVVVKDEVEEAKEDGHRLKPRKTGRKSAHVSNRQPRLPSSPCSEATTVTFCESTFLGSDDTILSFKPNSTLGKRAYTHTPSPRSHSPAFSSSGLKSPLVACIPASSPLPPSSPPPVVLSTPDPEPDPPSALGSGTESGLELYSCGLTLDCSSPGRHIYDEPSRVHCNQGTREISDFTCSLCTRAHGSPSGTDSLTYRVLFFRVSRWQTEFVLTQHY